ncbi:MAG: hypothetical protein RL021_1728, partial [Bacteroidota bacterium]
MPRIALLLFTLFLLLLTQLHTAAQGLSNQRRVRLRIESDTLVLDSLSIVPGSVVVTDKKGSVIDTARYREDWATGRIVFNNTDTLTGDSVTVRYRVLSVRLGTAVRHKDPVRLTVKGEPPPNPFLYRPSDAQAFSLFPERGIQANGSLARGISFGNNQDVFVNSSLNLQLNGKLNDEVELLASITDENIPIQPEGNTQQLQEFDRVFIQLSKDRTRLIAGDFELRRPDSYFMNFFKRGQGAYFSNCIDLADSVKTGKTRKLNSAASIAVAKGRFNRMVFTGTEGNQGPYRLTGGSGEPFIVVLSGTEKVFLDGQLMVRGMQNDYIIDYNTAEITFMPRRLITKDVRIIIEFEYTDRNYVRSMYYLNNEYVTDAAKIKLNIYSEQDSRNQPLLQELDSTRKSIMASVGDDISAAFVPTADSLSLFDDTRVLYIRKDTTTGQGTYPGIFVYSTDPAAARWQVTFSSVGAGNGDYVQDIRSANGRVYRWIEPVGGIHQGDHMPVQLLVTPKQRRMVTLGSDLNLGRKRKLLLETAWSDNDINLFSAYGKSNDNGLAGRIGFLEKRNLSSDTLQGWMLDTRIDYEITSKYFNPLEPYRPAEFNRDWNTSSLSDTSLQQLLSAESMISKPKTGNAGYRLKSYRRGGSYSGWNNSVFSDVRHRGFALKGSASLLTSEATLQQTEFLRHQFDLSKSLGKWIVGIRDNAEGNRFRSTSSDSLLANSYAWQEWYGYIGFADSMSNRGTLTVKLRDDLGAKAGGLVTASKATEYSGTAEIVSDPRSIFRLTSTYRDLKIIDPTVLTVAPTQTLVNRIDHSATIRKGLVTAVTYYEIGSGRDRKQEFYYLEVPAGQGTYAYIGDLNGNNVQDLNEFGLANFPDQAKYIRVFYATDEYVNTRSNSFSEVLNVQPGANRKAGSQRRFMDRFSDQFLLRLEKKTRDESILSSLNPFSRDLADSQLVSTNTTLRNTVFFNRTDPVFGMDYAWQQNRYKALLVNGFDYRSLTGHQ